MITAAQIVAKAARHSLWSERFIRFAAWLLDAETVFAAGHHGDYAHARHETVRGDAGGTTKYGIDRRSHPSRNIPDLTAEEALEIYWNEYWLRSLADHCPPGYGEIACDILVNGGNRWRIIQRGLNRVGFRLSQDGRFGPLTLAAMQQAGPHGLAPVLDEREAYYRALAQRADLRRFLTGWINRNNALRRLVGA